MLEPMSEVALKTWNRTAVRCLAGYKANERPISFVVGKSEIKIAAILKSWREPDHLYFKVAAEDNRLYQLRCDEYEDSWEVREFAARRQD